jgi:hypothetical protein
MRTCPTCGRQAAGGELFCRGCGSRLPEGRAGAETPGTPRPTGEGTPQPAERGTPRPTPAGPAPPTEPWTSARPAESGPPPTEVGPPPVVPPIPYGGASGAGPKRPRRTRLIVLALLAVIAVAAVVVFVMTRDDEPATSDGDTPAASPSPAASTTAGPTDAVDLDRYLSQDVLPAIADQMAYASRMRASRTPPGARVLGSHRMTRPRPNQVTWWGKGKAEGKGLDEVAVQLGAVKPPDALRAAHEKLVRVFRLEADRWYAFTACERKDNTDAFWPTYLRWSAKSKALLKTQQQLLSDWYYAVGVEADPASVSIPKQIKTFVEATKTLTE